MTWTLAMPHDPITVEIVYALPRKATTLRICLPTGSTLGQAMSESGILGLHPEINPATCRVGVFGDVRERTAVAADGDRIEIYRDLKVDSKQLRAARARKPPKPRG